MNKNVGKNIKPPFLARKLTEELRELNQKRKFNRKLLEVYQTFSKNYIQFNFLMLEISYYNEYKNINIPHEVMKKYEYYNNECIKYIGILDELDEKIHKEIKNSVIYDNREKYTCFIDTLNYIKNLQGIMNNHMPQFKS